MKVGLSDVALLWLSSSSFSNKRAKIMKRNAINRHKRERKKSLLLGGFTSQRTREENQCKTEKHGLE